MNAEHISVVVQGAVGADTAGCLKSIRKYLPEAQIILSTWENSNVSSLDGLYDVLLLNKDPGAEVFDDFENKANNLNRIIVSSRNGIACATRKYVLRLRSDLEIKNTKFLKLIDNFTVRNNEASLFKQRIFAYDIFSIKYDVKNKIQQRALFHISDWCYFGLKEDLEEFFNIPLVIEPDFSRYFTNHEKQIDDIHTTRLWKMSPEQYFVSQNAMKIFSDLDFQNYLDINEKNIKISEDFIINNFRVFSKSEWGIYTTKKLYKDINMSCRNPFSYYSLLEQQKDYKKYCDSSADIKNIERLERLYQNKNYVSLRKHFLQFLYCKPKIKIGELFSTIIYCIKFLLSIFKEILLCRKK